MGVTTTADRKLSEAKEHINSAIADLSEIIVGEVWGTEDFSDEYRGKLHTTLIKLLEIKRELK